METDEFQDHEKILIEEEEVKDFELGQERYLYVYGIINNQDIDFEVKGLRDETIEKIRLGRLAVLASPYPTLNPILRENEAMQHADILKEIAKQTAVIPMAFGTVFKDREVLETVLSKTDLALQKTLELIKDKVELGVKIIKSQTEETPRKVREEIFESLNALSIKSVEGDNFSERLLLNYSFLVSKNNFSKFSEEINSLEGKYKDLNFIYTGPWPPYSFVDIKIKGGG